MHARAARGLLQIENVLAQIEAVKEDRDRAEIDSVRSQPDAMRGDARQLHLQNPDGLRAFGDAIGDAEQLLDGEGVTERVG